MLLTLGKLVAKNLTQNTQTNVQIFLPCLQVLFSRKVHRHTVQMLSGTLATLAVHPRAKPAALPRCFRVFLRHEWRDSIKKQYRTHYIYYLQWMQTVK